MSEIKVTSVEHYFRALASACLEAAGNDNVRPVLLALLLIAPKTILELLRAERRGILPVHQGLFARCK